jgi:hypothetical protein
MHFGGEQSDGFLEERINLLMESLKSGLQDFGW